MFMLGSGIGAGGLANVLFGRTWLCVVVERRAPLLTSMRSPPSGSNIEKREKCEAAAVEPEPELVDGCATCSR